MMSPSPFLCLTRLPLVPGEPALSRRTKHNTHAVLDQQSPVSEARWNFKLLADVSRATLDGGKYETLFDRSSFRHRSNYCPCESDGRMRARLSRDRRRCLCRGWLGYRRARMERVPCRRSSSSSLWLWLRLAPEYAGLLPARRPKRLGSKDGWIGASRLMHD